MAKSEDQNIARKSGIVYAAVLSLLFSVLSFIVVGWALDRWLKTSPWMVVSGVIVGAGIGFFQFIRLISKAS